MSRGELYSVAQYFTPIGSKKPSYEYVRRHVPLQEATKAAAFYTSNVAAKMGITRQVMITNALDCVVWHWVDKKVVWPEPERPVEVPKFLRRADTTLKP